ncbi:hypothetical protein FRC07_003517 [Ceratobasidium sp. 392]|nr:hypothetical protein FRC07_003517 [Ceratobasidium sp. 392]
MRAFSIRRHKHSASDSSTILTEDPPMSTSQRSIYGSVISSSRTRNRLHKAHHSLDETHDPQLQHNDITKRPHRKLVKKSRQQQRSDSSPEERGSVTPPEQKPPSTILPASLRQSMEQPDYGWTENGLRVPSRGRAPPADMRYSVGSSADVLLTPIRGSTAISDDFVLLPAAHAAETAGPSDIVASPGRERSKSPEPGIATLATEPETHHEVEHVQTTNPDGPDPMTQTAALDVMSNSSSSDLGASFVSQSHSTLAETQTIHRPVPQINVNDIPPAPSEEATPIAPRAKGPPPPLVSVVECPVPKGRAPLPRPALTPRTSSKGSSVKAAEAHNLVPFPGDPEPGPWYATLIRSETDHEMYFNSSEPTLATWILTIWNTAAGIVLFAIECYRWLVRKGLRDDFRSCMSYWFLKELVVGFIMPLLLFAGTLWWFYRMVYPHYDFSPMTA